MKNVKLNQNNTNDAASSAEPTPVSIQKFNEDGASPAALNQTPRFLTSLGDAIIMTSPNTETFTPTSTTPRQFSTTALAFSIASAANDSSVLSRRVSNPNSPSSVRRGSGAESTVRLVPNRIIDNLRKSISVASSPASNYPKDTSSPSQSRPDQEPSQQDAESTGSPVIQPMSRSSPLVEKKKPVFLRPTMNIINSNKSNNEFENESGITQAPLSNASTEIRLVSPIKKSESQGSLPFTQYHSENISPRHNKAADMPRSMDGRTGLLASPLKSSINPPKRRGKKAVNLPWLINPKAKSHGESLRSAFEEDPLRPTTASIAQNIERFFPSISQFTVESSVENSPESRDAEGGRSVSSMDSARIKSVLVLKRLNGGLLIDGHSSQRSSPGAISTGAISTAGSTQEYSHQKIASASAMKNVGTYGSQKSSSSDSDNQLAMLSVSSDLPLVNVAKRALVMNLKKRGSFISEVLFKPRDSPSPTKSIAEHSPLRESPDEDSFDVTDKISNIKLGSSPEHPTDPTPFLVLTPPIRDHNLVSPSETDFKSMQKSIMGASSPYKASFATSGITVTQVDSKANESIIWYQGDVIGRGAFATVFLGLDMANWEMMAVKQIRLDSGGSKNGLFGHRMSKRRTGETPAATTVQKEIELMQELDHKNIVKYIGKLF